MLNLLHIVTAPQIVFTLRETFHLLETLDKRLRHVVVCDSNRRLGLSDLLYQKLTGIR